MEFEANQTKGSEMNSSVLLDQPLKKKTMPHEKNLTVNVMKNLLMKNLNLGSGSKEHIGMDINALM
jgi:hypothetical protein